MSGEVSGHVVYSAKELFEKVDAKLDTVLDRLDGKATKAELVLVEQRVDKLEQRDATRVAADAAQARLARAALALAGLAVAVAAVVVSIVALG